MSGGHLEFTKVLPAEACARLRGGDPYLTALSVIPKSTRGQELDPNEGNADARNVIAATLSNDVNYLRGLSIFGVTEVPDSLAQLTTLEELRFQNAFRQNGFFSMPMVICRLENLRILELAGHNITMFPSELSNLEFLQVLDVSVNQATTLPPECSTLTHLVHLNIGDNQIGDEGARDVANIFLNHPTLLKMTIDYNNIGVVGCGYLADMLDATPVLMNLEIDGNPGYDVAAVEERFRATGRSGQYWNESAGRAHSAIVRQLEEARDSFEDADVVAAVYETLNEMDESGLRFVF